MLRQSAREVGMHRITWGGQAMRKHACACSRCLNVCLCCKLCAIDVHCSLRHGDYLRYRRYCSRRIRRVRVQLKMTQSAGKNKYKKKVTPGGDETSVMR